MTDMLLLLIVGYMAAFMIGWALRGFVTQAAAVRALTDAGYSSDSVQDAVQAGDLSLVQRDPRPDDLTWTKP